VAGKLASGKTLSGSGIVAGAITNSGTISSTGAGLGFSGIISGVGQGIVGDLITFLDDGGFTGSGTIQIPVHAQAGSLITAIGSLSLGDPTSANGFVTGGQIRVGAQAVTLRSLTTIGLGSLTTIAGGTLTGTAPLRTDPGDQLAGVGTVASGLLNAGEVAPGSPIGTLAFSTDYQQGTSGILAVDLGNHAAGTWDRVTVGGVATLDGALHIVGAQGVTFNVGDVYRIMTFASRTGHFAAVTAENIGGHDVSLNYGSTFLDVRIEAPSGVDPAAPISADPSFVAHAGGTPRFELSLPHAGAGRIEIYDVTGRMVALLHEGPLPEGVSAYTLASGSSSALPSGIYFARLDAVTGGAPLQRTARLCLIR
jgi:hypothetical protein